MDEKDLLLLQLLEENSRLTTREMAVMAEIAPEEIEARIAALENAGVIRSYSAVIDWERAGNGEVSAIIELKVNPERDFGYDRIAERIARFRQVRSLRLITGAYDLQLTVTGKNMQEVARFVSEYIAPMDRIRETATHIIMKSYKENGRTFCEKEGSERIPYSL
ncbi:MAG: putative HTH-type transcriptional regulator [Methanoregulaceae archaeon PtaB.Bin056]|jgi:DNA-binding Lrp family transcriptional regulator|nr:MAG: putative HTH-type transcriptional regulator [Methanoregulaceae archaeon PtaB.Bin056]